MKIRYNTALVAMPCFLAVIGSFAASSAIRTALLKSADDRGGLFLLAALGFGGVGIWSMHFIGMLAFTAHGVHINYNGWLTDFSFVAGTAVMFAVIYILSRGEFGFFKRIVAGALVGAGMAAIAATLVRNPALPSVSSIAALSSVFALSILAIGFRNPIACVHRCPG